MEKFVTYSKPINVNKLQNFNINNYSSYEKKLGSIEKKFWDSPSPNFSFDTHQLGSDNIPPPIGKTPPNTPNKNFLENFKNKMIKINKQVNLKKTKTNNNLQNTNQEDIFFIEL